METIKKLPLSFFEKSRPNAPKKIKRDDEIIPFKWSNENEILSGKYKNDTIVELPKKTDRSA